MEDRVNQLVEKVWAKFQSVPPSQRFMVAISGIPGSGKTTLAATVTKKLNALYATANEANKTPIASFVPMDGYHLSRAQLDALPNPTHAHARRGAAFTFDAPLFLSLVQSLRIPLTSTSATIHAPSFDHALKDPVANDVPIPPTSRIIIFEGNYLSLSKGEWKQAAELMDELWFVEVEFDTAKKRLIPRHVKAGIAQDEKEAERRVVENDLVNGDEIVKDRMVVDEVIISRDDEHWKPKKSAVET